MPRDAAPSPGLRWPGQWGADPQGDGWRFAIWAPEAGRVALSLDGREIAMERDAEGFWTCTTPAEDGAAYGFVVDGTLRADPAARLQSDGIEGPSVLTRPERTPWPQWAGRPWDEAVLYELHVGTFTPQGTLAAAEARLPDLAALGFTVVSLMPLSHFPGRWGWGYDAALPGALYPGYGTPADLARFVATAQGVGMSVLLDLVLNHFGPSGNHLPSYAPQFFGDEAGPWGHRIDFTRPPVRAYFRDIALRWIAEYRLDGLRLDAVHEIVDPSPRHFLTELIDTVRAQDWGRPIHMVVEDERNIPDLIESGYTAQWNDDWHHALHVRLTGDDAGYLSGYATDPISDLARALGHGQVREGQSRPKDGSPRGKPAAHLPWTSFINHQMTHDQSGNRPKGERLIALAGPEKTRFGHALLAVLPFTPMWFMGEEEGSPSPFYFFADFDGELAEKIRQGRRDEMDALGHEGVPMADPLAAGTVDLSRPRPAEDAEAWRQLTREVLAFRAAQVVPLLKSGRTGPARVAWRGRQALDVRWPFEAGTLHLTVNFGAPGPAPQTTPLFAYDRVATDAYAFEVRVA